MNAPQLNTQQKLAVETTDGPLLIIAGPGSGKTHTLVERVVYLIAKQGVTPENILISTFTEKAAAELITRITNRLLEQSIRVNLNEMYIGTLHSICLSILEENRDLTRLKRSYSVIDQFEQAYFLFQRLNDFKTIDNSDMILGSPVSSNWSRANNLLSWLNKVSEEAISAEELLKSENSMVVALGECYQMYHQKLEDENVLDFSTIQYETLKLLDQNHDILSSYQKKIKYLMIDEYQDTNTIQEAIVLKLSGHHNNICVVGDDDQSLYRFRGATVRNILEFPSHFDEGMCKQVRLSINYRSHKGIIDFYNDWMDRDDWWEGDRCFRYGKETIPRDGEFPAYKPVLKVTGKESESEWRKRLIEFLKYNKTKGIIKDWNQVALLFSSVRHRSARELADSFEGAGIPVYSPRSNLFFDREEVRLVVGAMIFLFPNFPEIRQKYLKTHLPIWDYYDECISEFFGEVEKDKNQELLNWCREKRKNHQFMSSNMDYAFSGLFYELIQFSLFSRFLNVNGGDGVQDSRAARNLALISKILTKFEYIYHITVFTPKFLEKNIWDFFNHYFRFLSEGGIGEYEDESEYAPSGCVSFMTIHQSKGLEFPMVIVDSLYVIPRKQYTELDLILQREHYRKPMFEPIEQTKFYDFWRLYYTAFSRAKNLLLLTCFEKGGGMPVPSKYFREVYDKLDEWETEKNNFDLIDLAEIGEINVKANYSFTSHITLYENCSLQYKFFKDLAFTPVRRGAMMFGILVHETIEDIHNAALKGEENKINSENIESWFIRNYTHLSQREREYLAPQTQIAALNQVLDYARRHDDWSHLKQAEVDVSLVKDDYILNGKIDLIKGDGETVEIIDFKSEKKPDLESERGKINRYKSQLEVYAHIVEERTEEKVSKLHLYYTGEGSDGNPYVSFDKDSTSIEKTMRSFDRVVDNIEKKNYDISERPWKLCRNCDMRFYCDRNC